jgi:hypothetical protein
MYQLGETAMAKRRATEAETGSGPDPFAVLRPRLTKALVGLSSKLPQNWHQEELESQGRPEPAEFPVPDLVLFGLRNVLGFSWSGPEEKVRWSVYGMFTGVLVSFEMRKFGFTICVVKGANIDFKRLCGQLQVAVKHVEGWLAPLAELQAMEGNVTIANRHNEFDSRYRFFRGLADQSYRRADKKPRSNVKRKTKDELSAVFGDLTANLNHMMRAKTQAFYYSTAMVDAFFSRLEHMLVLLRAFCGTPLRNGELTGFLSMTWDDKLKALVDVDEPAVQRLYSGLKRIKERVRNPFAHGGVENDGGSLFVHIPTVGAMPANFTQIRDSVRFNFIPVDKDDHSSACAVFDGFEKEIREGPLNGAYSLVASGVDPSFAAEQLATYKQVAEGAAEEREEWCRHWHDENDRHANMDY